MWASLFEPAGFRGNAKRLAHSRTPNLQPAAPPTFLGTAVHMVLGLKTQANAYLWAHAVGRNVPYTL